MALAPKNILSGAETDFHWEREAIDFVLEALPDSAPHMAWPLHELEDPGTGRLYEIDLLVLARSALFLIEIKSHPGVLTGDGRDWTFTEAGGRQRHLACPYAATNLKAKVLATQLGYKMGAERPFVQPLIFVAHPEARIRLTGGCPDYVVTRDTIRRALVHGLPGAPGRLVNRPMMRQLRDTLRKLGLRPSEASRIVGGFRLQRLVDQHEGYQEHHAISVTVQSDAARVRSYLVPRATSEERRAQLQRAAEREAQVLSRLGHHPKLLSYRAYHPDGPLGPAVLFEAFEGGLPLSIFLKQEPDLSFDDRLSILQAIVEAIHHCHRADLLHRNLSPASVLVRRVDDALDVRVHRFQTAHACDHTSLGTCHVHELAEATDQLYQAPEVLRDPRKAQPASDVFSVGCIAWLLFTGEPPASSLADREARLREGKGLRIATVRAALAELDEALAFATEPDAINRADDALEWFEAFLMEDLTRPAAAPAPRVDPYEAKQGDELDGGLSVVRLLGSGATARVFKVAREGRAYALKVPHDEGCAQRLHEEGEVLARLRHQHIIQLHEVLELGGKRCLLLDYAGMGDGEGAEQHSSFADLLRSEGTLSLDKARRYGDDLLSAVQYLEERGITHRDIKPGNLGFTAQAKKARHLTLYDFSLASAEPGAIRAGTPQWRDPWLHARGRWDAAADRYAVAAVLYRMLAGTRAEFCEEGPTCGQVRTEPERFDPAIRDRLTGFFQRSFAEAIGQRFDSAEQMRAEWVSLFSRLSEPGAPVAPPDPTSALDTAALTTQVEALPLSSRAKNALDRAGVVTVADLIRLPRNHLSAIRGVGRRVAKEIVRVAQALAERLSAHDLPALMPDYAGPRLGLDALGLGLAPELVLRLHDAGVMNTADLAQMPRERAARLLRAEGMAQALAALEALAESQASRGTLDQWIDALLGPAMPRKSEAERRVRALLGLDPLPGAEAGEAPRDVGVRTVTEVAAALGKAPALVHGSLHTLRQRWRGTPCRAELEAALGEGMEALGPACLLEDAAAELVRTHGTSDEGLPAQRAYARVLVRLATELRPAPLHWRLLHGRAWLAGDERALDVLIALAAQADELARLEPLASSEQVRARLIALAAGSALALLPPDRLVALAAAASEGAAASARMEIYPRQMDAARAIRLSLNVLTSSELSEEALRQRVRARYPEAEDLPARPALDDLLKAHGLRFDPEKKTFQRPAAVHTTLSSTIQAPTRISSAAPDKRRRQSPEAMEAQSFQDALERGLESGRFRVVQVRADFAERAAALLAEAMGVEPVSLDHLIWREVHTQAERLEVDPAVIIATDRAGPDGPQWPLLKELVQTAAAAALDALLAARARPALLIHPGVLARFDLSGALARLSERAQREEGAAVVLVVPSHEGTAAPSINGHLPVPTEAGGQRLRLPETWLRNAHRAPAA
jgi:serine/threonine protein kinase